MNETIPYEALLSLSRIGIEIFDENDFNKNDKLVTPINELTKNKEKKINKKVK